MKLRYFGDGSVQVSSAPRSWRVALAWFAIASAGVAAVGPVQADDRVPANERSSARELQRIELRRAMSSTWERGDSSRVRRSLSDEERRALRRDLRDAMRGAYPDEVRSKSRR